MEKFLKYYFVFYSLALSFPYTLTWEPGMQIYFHLGNKCKRFGWLVTCAIFFIYPFVITFSLLKLAPEYLRKEDFAKLSFHGIVAFFMYFIFVQQLPHLVQSKDFLQTANGVVDLIKNLERNHFGFGAFERSQHIRIRLLYLIHIYSVVSDVTVIFPVFIIFQQGAWQLGSGVYWLFVRFFPDWILFGWILAFFVDAWMLFYICGVFVVSLHVTNSFMHTFKTAILLMIMPKFHRRRRESKVDILEEQMLIYSKLRILTTIYNGVYGKLYIAPLKGFVGMGIALSILMAVRFGQQAFLVLIFGISCATGCGICLTTFITFMSMVDEYSCKFKEYLDSQKFKGSLGRRIVRAFRKETVKTGNFYGIKRITCLTFLALVSNISGSLLISVKV